MRRKVFGNSRLGISIPILMILTLSLFSGGARADPTTYIVQHGDTLYRIAAQYGTSVNAISAANGIANPNRIYVGQSLRIPDSATAPARTAPQPAAPAPVSDTYTVQPGDTLYRIAARFGVTTQEIIAANRIGNPNLIHVGQVLWVRATATPPAVSPPPQAEPNPAAPTPAPTPAPAQPTQGATFAISGLSYSTDGRQAHMTVTVTNHSLTPALASGNWYPTGNPDGGRQWVTLIKAEHQTVPVPLVWDPVHGRAPLWEFRITTDDGLTFSAFAGCVYHDTIVGEGFEPTAEGGFYWTHTLEGGWFRCGRDYDGAPKPPVDLLPGQSASVPLEVWLVHPDVPAGQAPQRHIVKIDFVPYAPDGSAFGVQDSLTLP